MPKSTIDAQIRARIESFTHELAELVKHTAVESVQEALGGSAAPARRRGPGRPRKATSVRRKPGRRPGRLRKAKATAKASKRVRRTAENLEALAGKVLAHVKANAGHRLEQISAGLKIASKELKRPVATLVETKKLRTEGQKRGTRYYAGGKRMTRKKTAPRKVGQEARQESQGGVKKKRAKGGTRTPKKAPATAIAA